MSLSDREFLKELYPGKKWSEKVDKMSDRQVFATKMRIQNNPKK